MAGWALGCRELEETVDSWDRWLGRTSAEATRPQMLGGRGGTLSWGQTPGRAVSRGTRPARVRGKALECSSLPVTVWGLHSLGEPREPQAQLEVRRLPSGVQTSEVDLDGHRKELAMLRRLLDGTLSRGTGEPWEGCEQRRERGSSGATGEEAGGEAGGWVGIQVEGDSLSWSLRDGTWG